LSTKKIQKTLIIGLGLIGGSFARSCKKHQISEKLYACDLDPDAITLAKDSKIIDEFISLDENLLDFDLIVLATPLSTYKDIVKKIAPKISNQTIIVELGSVKEIAIKNKILLENLRNNFVLCHPIAGSEKTGFESSSEDLFLDKKFIICPENTSDLAIKFVERIITKIGGKVEFLEAKKHNEIYALVSHLPQFLSFLSLEFSPKEITDNFFNIAFRLDNSDPKIWGEIFKLNESNIEEYYFEFFDNLEKIEKRLKQNQFSELLQEMSLIKKDKIEFDEKFLEENFSSIFFRVIFVASYLRIKDINNFLEFAGSGFRDFISITSVLHLEEEKLTNLLKQNQKKILKLFESLS
jgi:prephenate dehydrogenase